MPVQIFACVSIHAPLRMTDHMRNITMNIGVLGTGGVGQTIAAKLVDIGHSVMIGTRDVGSALARMTSGGFGTPFGVWYPTHQNVQLGTFAQAAGFGEIVINAVSGHGTLAALEAAGDDNLNNKILIDISNPLDFSQGMPPSLFVSNTESLAERIQARFPATKVVKTLNTVTAALMVNPHLVADGDHHIFVSGNDAAARAAVTGYLKDWFGWIHVVDLGDITSARGVEMMLPAWVRLLGVLGTPMFNFKIVR
jgi:hypothetical protein